MPNQRCMMGRETAWLLPLPRFPLTTRSLHFGPQKVWEEKYPVSVFSGISHQGSRAQGPTVALHVWHAQFSFYHPPTLKVLIHRTRVDQESGLQMVDVDNTSPGATLKKPGADRDWCGTIPTAHFPLD